MFESRSKQADIFNVRNVWNISLLLVVEDSVIGLQIDLPHVIKTIYICAQIYLFKYCEKGKSKQN